jgi:hypothetical protein
VVGGLQGFDDAHISAALSSIILPRQRREHLADKGTNCLSARKRSAAPTSRLSQEKTENYCETTI